jgi:NitT/TauT family transport system substrate-binding protein
MRPALHRVIFSALALSFVAALFVAPAARAAEPLKIGYSDWPGYTAWEVAIQKGWFKEAGVEVEFIFFEYGPSLDAFSAGKIDAVTMVCGDSLVNGANGKPSTAIVIEDYSNGNDMIIGKPGINGFRDLKGKKIGLEFGLVEHLLLLKGLEAAGMKDTDVEIVKVATNDTPQTLASGGVDAIGAWYPVSGQALRQVPGSKPLYTTKDVPGLVYDALHVSRESLNSRRDDWKKVVGVWFKVVDYIDNPSTRSDAARIMAAKVGVNARQYERSMEGTAFLDLKGNLKHLKKGDGLDSVYGSLKTANDFYVKAGVYKDAQDPRSYLDPSLVEEVSGKKVETAQK